MQASTSESKPVEQLHKDKDMLSGRDEVFATRMGGVRKSVARWRRWPRRFGFWSLATVANQPIPDTASSTWTHHVLNASQAASARAMDLMRQNVATSTSSAAISTDIKTTASFMPIECDLVYRRSRFSRGDRAIATGLKATRFRTPLQPVIRRVPGPGGSNPFSGLVRHTHAMGSVIVVAWTLIALAIASFVGAVGIVVAKRRQATWMQVQARVVRSRVEYLGEEFVADVAYTYSFGGIEYEGSTVGSLQIVYNWRGPAERKCARYPDGATVTAYVDRHDPARSMLEAPRSGASFVLLVASILCCIVGLALI